MKAKPLLMQRRRMLLAGRKLSALIIASPVLDANSMIPAKVVR
jgi:hypothetical protein